MTSIYKQNLLILIHVGLSKAIISFQTNSYLLSSMITNTMHMHTNEKFFQGLLDLI